ncbi:hypothetical protein KIN20_014309 [Parelaphostrongylus tenuis]|uniref:Uncharacterized protein n=1 Tax=Parelaphostrongylus tenuis TaxID=148309 RepID=A0AAD5QLL2_PARTN|nr:hypothetical protein KIN20_014309 [Parelaphostrongylus tenuis]
MHSLGNTARVPTRSLLIVLPTTGAVLRCGTVPGGPAQIPPISASSKTWRINATGFGLPVVRAFSTDAAAHAQVPRFHRIQVLDALKKQGRAAGLSDFVITTISCQLGINVFYTPLSCPKVSVYPTRPVRRDPLVIMMRTTCVIFGNTVTTTCHGMGAPGAGGNDRTCTLGMAVDFTPIPPQPLSISGTLTVWIVLLRNITLKANVMCLDLQSHHGDVKQGNVAKCSEQSGFE